MILAEPYQIAVPIGHLARYADLVAVEVVDFLSAFAVRIGVAVNLRQRFVTVLIGVDIGISAVAVYFLNQAAATPYKLGNVFEAV
ncbi:hypothetical protein BV914_11510 [Neisseria dumasiana]|nr:hypothetical protein BV914_11510 [Neisseria dumasiana]